MISPIPSTNKDVTTIPKMPQVKFKERFKERKSSYARDMFLVEIGSCSIRICSKHDLNIDDADK